MVWKLLKTVGKAVVEAAKLVLPRHMGYVADMVIAVVDDDGALAEQREELQLAQLKLQYVQNQEGLKFQKKQAKLSTERAEELQAFIQCAEDVRLQNNLDFQWWCLEQEKDLQLELFVRNHDLQRELVVYQRQSSLKVVEEQKRLENSPIWLVASDILNSHPEDELMPLRVVFEPPKLQLERFTNAATTAKRFPDIELTLAEGLRQFFRNYSTSGRTIDFLAGAWVSKSFHSEASIKALFGVLKSEPTLVLESEVDGDYLNFRIAYWGLNWSKYRYEPIISRLPYRDILYEAAKTRARQWLKTKEKLIAAGESSEDVEKLYGRDNVKNLETLQREERFRAAGIDSSELELNYSINKKDFEKLCQFLIIYHCVFAGLVADEYFLVQGNLPPLLPELFPGLTENVPDTEVVQELIQSIVVYYQNVYQALESERSSWIPELALDLALSWAHLPDKVWAKQQIVHSGQAWLELHGLSQPEEVEAQNLAPLLEAIESVLRIEDLDYVEKLNQCLVVIGDDQRLKVTEACYNRANAYYKLGNHEEAIAYYNQALSINPDFTEAHRNRDIAQGVLGEIERREQQHKHPLEKAFLTDTLIGHSHQVFSLAFSPDGQTLASGSWDDTIKLWQLSTKQEIRTLKGHTNDIRVVLISPDGQTIASGSDDCTIKLWQLSTGQQIRTLKGHSGWIYSLAFSLDGQTLISGSADETIRLWQLSTGKEIRTLKGHSGRVYSLAVNPDGQMLVSGSDDTTIKIWQLSTGQEIRTLKSLEKSSVLSRFCRTPYELTGTAVYSLAISPDGQTLASGSGNNTIKIWQFTTGQELRTLTGHSGRVHSLAISSDGYKIVSASADKTIKIWHLRTGQELCTITEHSDTVYGLAISPDGQTLVSGSADNSIKIWRVP